MTGSKRAFYASTGSRRDDLVAILHPPYTAWHLAYVAIGAALAPELDGVRLAGTLAAFALGTGVFAHVLDEWYGRPLRTALPDGALLAMAAVSALGVLVISVLGAWLISPWVLGWAAVGTALAAGYALERPWWMHHPAMFAAAWGGFPVLVGYWAQAEALGVPALMAIAAATLLSAAQRALSTPARFVRRGTDDAEARFATERGPEHWDRETLLESWERPLRLMALTTVLLGLALLARHW